MKREFTNENFERFLKESADSFRLKAPDKVWENLSRELHKRRRRFVIGLSAFLLISSAVGYYTISNFSKPVTGSSQQVQTGATISVANNQINKKPSTPSTLLPANNTTAANNNLVRQSPTTYPRRAKAQPGINPLIAPVLSPVGSIQPKATSIDFTGTVVDSYTEFDANTPADVTEKTSLLKTASALPFTIESVVNTYRLKSRKAKIEKQFYFTPTVSYRKLTENKSYLRSLDPNAIPANYPALYSSVNSNVTHKPDLGFELGYTVKYPVSKNVKVRAGLQFNVNRYDVKAFSSPLSVTTIALNNGGSRIDSFNTVSGYSNVNGYKSNWLQNFSFQVSAPVGVEYLFSKNDKVEVGVATTIQPTYVLGDRAYLISTDYKNYTQVPWLVRRWNVNTALETFVVVNSAKARWQVGPQVRYQLLSSFISKYPVKENLFDFGLKLGVSLNK